MKATQRWLSPASQSALLFLSGWPRRSLAVLLLGSGILLMLAPARPGATRAGRPPAVAGSGASSGAQPGLRIAAALNKGQVAITVDLANSRQAFLLSVGSRVDLYPVLEQSQTSSSATASDLLVLAVLSPSSAGPITTDAASGLVVACDRAVAARLAGASSRQFIASLRPPD